MSLSISVDSDEEFVLLASCAGDEDTGGGLCSFDGRKVETIDRVSSAGLCVTQDRIFRLLRTPLMTGGGEMLIYDSRGVKNYLRVDELADGHYIAWDGRHVVVASTGTNSILWLTPGGEVARVWRAPGEDDSWHLNDLTFHEGRLYVCAFGNYAGYRGYKGFERHGHGHVFDLENGRTVASGLCAPHSPRFFDGYWSVCNSMNGELVQFDAPGRIRRSVELAGFTRGLAIGDRYVFVGESSRRSDRGGVRRATIAVIDRETFELVDRVGVPFQEISDLALAPAGLAAGASNGFRTNHMRTSEQDQLSLFREIGINPQCIWASSDPLAPEQCRVRVEASLPAEFDAGKLTLISCAITNRSECFYCSAIPNPVYISYKWQLTERSPAMDHQEGLRTSLPRMLAPAETLTCRIEVLPPPLAGEFLLTITLVQEGVGWFDEFDPCSGFSCLMQIKEPANL